MKLLWGAFFQEESKRASFYQGFVLKSNLKILPTHRTLSAQAPLPYKFTVGDDENWSGNRPDMGWKHTVSHTPLYPHCLAHVGLSWLCL